MKSYEPEIHDHVEGAGSFVMSMQEHTPGLQNYYSFWYSNIG